MTTFPSTTQISLSIISQNFLESVPVILLFWGKKSLTQIIASSWILRLTKCPLTHDNGNYGGWWHYLIPELVFTWKYTAQSLLFNSILESTWMCQARNMDLNEVHDPGCVLSPADTSMPSTNLSGVIKSFSSKGRLMEPRLSIKDGNHRHDHLIVHRRFGAVGRTMQSLSANNNDPKDENGQLANIPKARTLNMVVSLNGGTRTQRSQHNALTIFYGIRPPPILFIVYKLQTHRFGICYGSSTFVELHWKVQKEFWVHRWRNFGADYPLISMHWHWFVERQCLQTSSFAHILDFSINCHHPDSSAAFTNQKDGLTRGLRGCVTFANRMHVAYTSVDAKDKTEEIFQRNYLVQSKHTW